MYLRFTPNLLHFLPDFGALYALRRALNFYEIHHRLLQENGDLAKKCKI
jgi:hypothetical protein